MKDDDGFRNVRVAPKAALLTDASSLLSWPARRWLVALVAAALYVAAAGLVTDVITNPLAARVVPPTWWSYPVLAVTGALGGLITASYLGSRTHLAVHGRAAGGGVLSMLAIGCPACNKLVVLAVGTSGALNLWAPLQPIVGIGSVVLLAGALHLRLTGEASCPLPDISRALDS